MSLNPDCGNRKHAYEFSGNKTFKSMTMSERGTTVRFSQNAVYKCKTCGKTRRGPVKRGEPNDSL